MNSETLDTLIVWFDFLGIVAFALSGVFAGMKRQTDPVGVFILAFSTAFGGGMLRDLVIDRRPFYWIDHEAYIYVVLLIAMAAPLINKYFMKSKNAYNWYIFADAIGLGVFCISGTSLALAVNIPLLPSVILGVITGVFGGLMRDVFLNTLPGVVADRQPYASVGFLGCWLFIGLLKLGLPFDACMWIGLIFIVAFRMLCFWKNWQISYFKQDER
ncbi:MAG: trimeric intracellular cation channel family protein [Burkholderiaceae bacterium]|nr:trimeric intracellular cation channel family protein [Burkholderiaceae bacterium]